MNKPTRIGHRSLVILKLTALIKILSMKAVSIYAIIITLAFSVLLLSSNNKSENSVESAETEKEETSLPQIIQGPHIEHGVNLGGELVPIENFDAKERLERELMVNSYWHSSTLMFLKNANRYFPIMEPILAENGVPDDFKYLAVAESALRNAKSPAGARGIWQFMPTTGKAYGLVINDEVDERYHVEKATQAACKYLKDYYNRFGSWTLAAAAYNMGGPRLSKVMAEQKATSYYHLNLNAETARYVFRVIAIKEIMKNPSNYGFYLDQYELYPPFDNYSLIQVDGPITSWGDFALQYGTNYRMLKVYNPWLRKSTLANRDRRVYTVKVPRI